MNLECFSRLACQEAQGLSCLYLIPSTEIIRAPPSAQSFDVTYE